LTILENVWAWATAAASNATIDSGINWAEGQDPGTVNNSARGMMAATKKWANVLSGNVTVSNIGDAYTVTTGQAIESGQQALGFRICFRASATNTGAATVAVDGLSAVAIKRPNNDALSAGDIVSGGFFDLAFDGTNYKLLAAGAAAGTYGALAGSNTWTGTNNFQAGATVGDAAADVVTIKGTLVSAYGVQIIGASSAATVRAYIGLGTAAQYNIGTSGATVPLLNGNNTWSTGNNFIRNGGGVPTNGGLIVSRTDDVAGGTEWYQILFGLSVGAVGSITSRNLGLGTGDTIYNTTSDERLKHASTPLVDSGDVIDQLQPIRFRWGSVDGPEDFGFSAQALHAVVPQVVTPGKGEPGDKDFVPWMREKGALEAILVAEIKALRARVAALEAG
jgi:hypothetical protein